MKKEFFSYWTIFCICGLTYFMTPLLIKNTSSDQTLHLHFSKIAILLSMPLLVNKNSSIRPLYRNSIGFLMCVVIGPLTTLFEPSSILLTRNHLLILTSIFALLSLSNYLYKKRRKP